MKVHSLLLFLIAVPLSGLAQSSNVSASGRFTLQITDHHVKGHSLQWDFDNTANKSLRVGSSVVIAVRKTNISNHKIEKVVQPGWLWDVRDSSGNPVGPSKKRNPGGWIIGGGPGVQSGTQEMFLQPGQSAIHSGDLTWGFDLSHPGTYTFQVSQHLSDNPKSPVVNSNTLTITLLPANASSPESDNTSPSPNASGTTPSSTNSPSSTTTSPGSLTQSAAPTARIISVPATQKPKPTFTLSIKADPTSAQTYPSLHRVSVTFTNISSRILVSRFHPESKNMYNMVVTRDGAPVPGTAAMKALQQYRRVDNHPTIRHPALLYPGRSVTTSLDVGDYYNMTQPGTYRVTITRPSLPSNLPYSTQVRSNTITMTVPLQTTAAQNAQTPPKAQPRFSLNLSSNAPYGTPPPSMLTVEMDNLSNQVIRIARCWPFMGMYNFVVTRDGQPVPPTRDMLRLQRSRDAVTCPGNDTMIEIKPGDTYSDDVPIGDFYNVSQPGVYQIYATRQTHPWNPAKSTLVQSNAISFQVQ